MCVHITLHHEPSLVEETHLEIDWIDIEDDNDLEVTPTPVMRKVRKVRITIIEE